MRKTRWTTCAGEADARVADATSAACRVWAVYPTAPASQREGAPYVTLGLETGWLSVDRGEERRRMVPVPAGWVTAPDSDLASLWTAASVVAPTGRVERGTRRWAKAVDG